MDGKTRCGLHVRRADLLQSGSQLIDTQTGGQIAAVSLIRCIRLLLCSATSRGTKKVTQLRKYRAILTVLLALAAPTGWTEYDAFKLGEGAGSYLYSVAILSVLHVSECGYLIKRVPDYNAVVSEVASSFRDSDREKLSALYWSHVGFRLNFGM
jgi:hypothetical protein